MPPNIEANKARRRYVWRSGNQIYVSFPDIRRAFRALELVTARGISADYTGSSAGRHWIMIFNPNA